jgi:tRNA pseudouridine13 synthase
MPRRFQAEAAIIQYLGKRDRKTGKLLQETDWQGALMQIQRNLRLMYVHAYQSHVWNAVVGKRWELYGSQVVEGDLVIVGEKDDEVGAKKDEVDEDGEPIFHPAADDSAPTTENAFTRARHLTDAEAKSERYDIFDVVLPLPGFDVLYPANAIGKFCEEFMASEAGGGLDPHKMRRGWKDISLSGGYRKVMAKSSRKLEYEVKTYANDEDQMVETDLEKFQKGHTKDAFDGNFGHAGEVDGSQPNQKIAVVLKMQLGSSQYATIALRELTKGGAVNYKPDYSAR